MKRINNKMKKKPILKISARFLLQFFMLPITIHFILNSKKIHPSYKMNAFKKLKLGFTMALNNVRIGGTHFTSQLAMALKILETPPPKLIGAGTGLPLGMYYIGPYSEYDEHPRQKFSSAAYTRKDMLVFGHIIQKKTE